LDAENDHDEGIDSAIESRSLSINTSDDGLVENDSKQSKKPVRSLHSSSTRRKIDRLFNNGADFESASTRTITPENSNESGVYSQQSGRELDNEIIKSAQSTVKDQLFSTKPRLARSGSKTKLDKSQLPPTDPSLSSRQTHDHTSTNGNTHRTTNTNVEVIGKGYIDEKIPLKQLFPEPIDDKQPIVNKPRAKIIKGNYQIILLSD
jgi:hypothetical protein